MANVATVRAPSGFLLTRPRAESAGAPATVTTTTARGQQLHSQIQQLHHRLLPPQSGFSDTGFARLSAVGTCVGLVPGIIFSAIGAFVAVAGGGWDAVRHGLTLAAPCWGIAALSGAAYAIGWRHHVGAVARKAGAQAPHATDLARTFGELSELERAVVGYRAHSLLRELGDMRAKSVLLRNAMKPMVDAFETLMPDQKAQAERLTKLLDSIVLGDGTVASGVREDTELLTQRVEGLVPDERAVVANLARDAVQIALNANNGNRWRLRRLLEALDGKRTPYATEDTSETSTASAPVAPNQEVTLKRCIALLEGGLAVERAADDPMRAHAKIIPSTNPALAEQTAAYFERAGYRAAIYDDGNRLVVSVFNPTHPPRGFFVRGVVS